MYNVIVTGCSYSIKAGVDVCYPDILNTSDNYNVTNLAWPGQSNDTIIRNIKEEIRKGTTNTLFICQLTHLHRISHFCHMNKKWLDFQPAYINTQPLIKDDKVQFDIEYYYTVEDKSRPPMGWGNIGAVGIYGATHWTDLNLDEEIMIKLLKWYEDYLVYIYDETQTFIELHHKVDELTNQVKNSGNDILYLYWPEDSIDISLFKKNNFLSIDNQYSLLKWSVKNKLTQPEDSHLTIAGHYKLANEICKHLGTDDYFKLPFL